MTWDEARLQRFVDDQEVEADNLDFKTCDALRLHNKTRDKIRTELSKDVSALANSAGGVIVYGIREGKGGHAVSIDDEYAFDTARKGDLTAEDLANKIAAVVQPTPVINVHRVDLSSGRYALVVEVERQLRGCQASDGRYYRRAGRTTYALSDWEVRELVSRRGVPHVDLEISTSGVEVRCDPRGNPRSCVFVVDFVAVNRGQTFAGDWAFVASLPASFGFTGGPVRGKEVTGRGVKLFPQERRAAHDRNNTGLVVCNLVVSSSPTPLDDLAIEWTIYADDAPPRHGRTPMSDLIPPGNWE